jgi:hypothetical protein
MADLRVTQLPPLLDTELENADPLLISDASASESKKISPVDLLEGSARLAPDGTIPSSKLAYPLPPQVVDNQAIIDQTIEAGKLVPDTLTANEIAPNAIGASELANAAVDTAAIQPGAVTGSPGGSIAANTIDTSNIVLAGLENGAIADGAITYSKTDFEDGDIPGAKITPDSITAGQIGPNAIGASELADNSVDNSAIQVGAVTGSLSGSIAANTITAENMGAASVGQSHLQANAVDTVNVIDKAITESKVSDAAITERCLAADSVGVQQLQDASVDTASLIDESVTTEKIAVQNVTADRLAADLPGTILAPDTLSSREIGPEAIGAQEISVDAVDRGLDKDSGRIGHTNALLAGTASGLDYDIHGHITGPSAEGILSAELPIATEDEPGAVMVPSDSGLSVSAAGRLSHEDSVVASTVSGLTYNETGHITQAVPLTGDDLPPATATNLGGVSVPGPTVIVDGAGAISHNVSGVTAGEYPKVVVDAEGHVISGDILSPIDIPELNADKITAGQLPTERLADRSVTQQKLADYSIAFIQEDMPIPDPGGPTFHNGCLWFQESTGQLNMWNGNSWMPVARGALAAQNLRWGGGIDAETGLCSYLTDFGVAAGLEVGEPLRVASDTLSGLYLVVTKAGTSIDVDAVRGLSFGEGDWVLCVDSINGWIRIDQSSAGGGGGGGGASFLDQLNDVTISGLVNGQLLQYNGTSAQWENKMTINWANLNLSGAGSIVTYATTNGGELIACTEIDGGNY